MIESNNVIETSEDRRLKSIKKWELICKTSNIILSVIYVLFGWIFGFFIPNPPFSSTVLLLYRKNPKKSRVISRF